MSKHTKGPWRYVHTGTGWHGVQMGLAGGFKLPDIGEAEANAHLIAAAPELLEALLRCKFDSLNMSLDDVAFCRAAIAKARGEANE